MIQSPLCRMPGIDFPLFAFTHRRGVSGAVVQAFPDALARRQGRTT